ncbi:ROK family protein, partial [Arthrobacter sp.]
MGKNSIKLKDGRKLPSTVIGIDIGGTGIKGGIVDLAAGAIVGDRFRVETPQPATPEAVAVVVADIVAELSTREGAPSEKLPIGVTFPAIIQHGVARSAANVDESWIDTDVDALFTKVLGRDVHVINDADAAGLAEVQYGA